MFGEFTQESLELTIILNIQSSEGYLPCLKFDGVEILFSIRAIDIWHNPSQKDDGYTRMMQTRYSELRCLGMFHC